VYASDALSTPAAVAISLVTRRRVICHEHDAPAADGANASASWFMRLVLGARARLARRAAWCVLPNAGRLRALAAVAPERVLTVWNCPSRDEVAAMPPRRDRGGLRVLFHGSIGPGRVPLTFIDALARLPESVTFTIAGYETVGHQGYLDAIRSRARALGIEGRVSYAGVLATRRDLLAHCAGFDVGVSLMPMDSSDLNEQTMVGASNKPFDYLACGLPVLVSDLPEWRSTYADAGYGLACDPASPESIAAALGWWLAHPAERAAMGERGRARIAADWNYEARFAPVLARMDAAA
jgi:glycosyltransferase involved in cell wall biosynthesis